MDFIHISTCQYLPSAKQRSLSSAGSVRDGHESCRDWWLSAKVKHELVFFQNKIMDEKKAGMKVKGTVAVCE